MKGKNKLLRSMNAALRIGAAVAAAAAADFGLTFWYSLIPEVNDGICGPSLLMRLLWGEDGWTRVGYFAVFRGALLTMLVLMAAAVLTGTAVRKRNGGKQR